MYVCYIYIYIYFFMCTYIHIHVHTCLHVVLHIYVRTYGSMYVCVCVQLFTKKIFEMAAENIKVGSSPYNFIHELIVYIESSPVTSKNKSSLHTFPFSWSTMSGTSVGNFVQILLPGAQEKKLQSCATEKTRNPQNTNRSSQPHCLSIFLYFNKKFRKSMPFPAHWKVSKKNSVFNRKIPGFFQHPTHRRGMRASRRDSTSPSVAPIGALGGKKAEKRGKSSQFPTLPGEIELV